MKKFLVFLLVAILVISLAACKNNEVSNQNNTQDKVEESVENNDVSENIKQDAENKDTSENNEENGNSEDKVEESVKNDTEDVDSSKNENIDNSENEDVNNIENNNVADTEESKTEVQKVSNNEVSIDIGANDTEKKALKLAEDAFYALMYWDEEFLKKNLTKEFFEEIKKYKDDIALGEFETLKKSEIIKKEIEEIEGIYYVYIIEYEEIDNSEVKEIRKFQTETTFVIDIGTLKIKDFGMKMKGLGKEEY